VDDDEAVGRRQALDVLAVGGEQLAWSRRVAAVVEAVARGLQPCVREGRPQPPGVPDDRGGALQRLRSERVLVVDVGIAEGLERGRVAP
jgi:hypothetical protein